MSHSITDVARRTGVPSSTLRYYDRLGLLPSTSRGPNRYRQFDDRGVDRLRFIVRAKALGCTLREIASLLTAFDRDCADVQGPLRELIDVRIADAELRISELGRVASDLRDVRHALSTVATDGPCGPDCPCFGGSTTTSAELEPSRRREDRIRPIVSLPALDPPIACTLDDRELGDRMAEWRDVLADIVERRPIDGGVRLTLGPDVDDAELMRLIHAEAACCSFFAFAVTVDHRGTALEVRAPADARDLLATAFGSAS